MVRKHIIFSAPLALIPFVHLGINEFLSIQFFMWVLLFLFLIDKIVEIFTPEIFFKIFLFLTPLLIIVLRDGDIHSILIYLRFLVSVLIMLLIVKVSSNINTDNFVRFIQIIAILIFFISVLQFISIYFESYNYLRLPNSFYALNYGTLDFENRPRALFSEPSTLGLFGLIIIIFSSFKNSPFLKITGVSIVLISYSFASYIFLIIVLLKDVFKGITSGRISRRDFKYSSILILIFMSLFLNFDITSILFERSSRIFDQRDMSYLIRLNEPLLYITKIINDGMITGIPKTIVESTQSIDHNIFNTHLLNPMILYGVFGLVSIVSLIFLLPSELRFTLIVLLLINGDALYYDRIMFFILAVILWRHEASIKTFFK
jgi:hypothetical protein